MIYVRNYDSMGLSGGLSYPFYNRVDFLQMGIVLMVLSVVIDIYGSIIIVFITISEDEIAGILR